MLINFFFFSRNLKQAKRKKVCSNKNKATLNCPVEWNLKGVVLMGNILRYVVVMVMLKQSADCMPLH